MADRGARKIVIWGFVLALLAVVWPPTAIPALVLGVIAMTRNRVGMGVAILLLAMVFGYAGLSFGLGRLADDKPGTLDLTTLNENH